MSLLQIVIDAIHDEQDWAGIASGIVDQDQVERRQALNVLAMPEMEAIRQALRDMAQSLAYGCNDDTNHADADGRFTLLESRSTLMGCWLAEFLPDHVSESIIQWVLG